MESTLPDGWRIVPVHFTQPYWIDGAFVYDGLQVLDPEGRYGAPGATWFRTEGDAQLAIDILLAGGRDATFFWHLWDVIRPSRATYTGRETRVERGYPGTSHHVVSRTPVGGIHAMCAGTLVYVGKDDDIARGLRAISAYEVAGRDVNLYAALWAFVCDTPNVDLEPLVAAVARGDQTRALHFRRALLRGWPSRKEVICPTTGPVRGTTPG